MPMEKLRQCCGVDPIVVLKYFDGARYKMYKIKCPRCGIQTGAKQYYENAVREWNNTEDVHTNYDDTEGTN